MKGSDLPDLNPQVPKCTAAKGLPGDSLVCVDFSSISDQMLGSTSLPQQLTNWSFNTPPNCWEVKGGVLQIVNFQSLMTTCSFTLPQLDLTQAPYDGYDSFTLSVVQNVEINTQRQSASIDLSSPVQPQQIWYSTSTNSLQTLIVGINKAMLPNGGSNTYQPLFELVSNVSAIGYQGWTIESVAVIGSP
jgi:hypothetical protein